MKRFKKTAFALAYLLLGLAFMGFLQLVGDHQARAEVNTNPASPITYTLVIAAYTSRVTVPGYHSKESCQAAADRAKLNESSWDPKAYCLAVQ